MSIFAINSKPNRWAWAIINPTTYQNKSEAHNSSEGFWRFQKEDDSDSALWPCSKEDSTILEEQISDDTWARVEPGDPQICLGTTQCKRSLVVIRRKSIIGWQSTYKRKYDPY